MKRYNIKVNGTSYEVEVEEYAAVSAPAAAPAVEKAPATKAAAPVPAAPTPAPAVEKAPAAAQAKGSIQISAPMPGTILRVDVVAGDVVKKGQNLVILEAMKMENEIVAPSDATVVSVIAKGASVNAGDLLVSLN
ncbi:MAG TPA: acetyl-CoA carboxylase biotin carboxyl carrier protein subunit [Clostridiales bacterium]|nr:acetyl-CoA carboxylase biotin carboxyl carrier protein subunit [Clostridiales bacterium]